MINKVKKIKQYIHRFKVRKKCIIEGNVTLDSAAKFEGKNRITKDATLLNVSIGYASYIGNRSFIKNTKMGRYCCIGPDVVTIVGSHPTSEFVSTHPAFYSVRKQAGFTYVDKEKYSDFNYLDKENHYSVIVGNDVWIGEGVRLLEGITIGDGVIIAAGAIVTKDVPPYAVVGGVPAKVIRYRFEKEDIEFLESLKWWEKDEKWFREYAEYFEDIKKLRNILEKR